MKAWLRDLWSAARLRKDVFAGLCGRSDAFLQGFLVIVVVALVAGLPAFVRDLAGGMGTMEPADRVAAEGSVRQALEDAAPWLDRLGIQTQAREEIVQVFEMGLDVGTEVEALPTALPGPVVALFRALGSWLSRPFAGGGFPLAAAALGTWLGYGIWVMLFAKLLGGRGTLHGFYGATALYALPHLLAIFGLVPVLGPALGFVAFAWGAAIYVTATAVSHQLSLRHALLAVLSPLVLLILLATLLLPLVTGTVVILLMTLLRWAGL